MLRDLSQPKPTITIGLTAINYAIFYILANFILTIFINILRIVKFFLFY